MKKEKRYYIVENGREWEPGKYWGAKSEKGCREFIDVLVRKGEYRLEDVHVEEVYIDPTLMRERRHHTTIKN
jgi:hypothetical protein